VFAYLKLYQLNKYCFIKETNKMHLHRFLAAREMISIMQEYGEIVCCIGSSLNVDNLEIFNQADIR
jgi:hypothetical protein